MVAGVLKRCFNEGDDRYLYSSMAVEASKCLFPEESVDSQLSRHGPQKLLIMLRVRGRR